MRCPFCGHEDSQVKDSRPTEDNAAVRRRRFCSECGSRWTTFERVQLRELTVVKKEGGKAPFEREKLARSLREETGIKNLCLAGGVALNCVANGVLLRENIFDNIWIQPASGDAGSSLGGALIGWHQYHQKVR